VRLPTCRRAPRRSATGRSCGRVPAASASPVIRACCTPGRLWANALGHKRSNTNAHVARSQTVEHTRCSATNGRTSTETPADFDRAKSIQPFMTEQRLRSRSSKSSRVDRPRCFVTNGRTHPLLGPKRSNTTLLGHKRSNFERNSSRLRPSRGHPAIYDRAAANSSYTAANGQRLRCSTTKGRTHPLLGHKRTNARVARSQTVEHTR
jgi:hypothetical protein